MHETDERRSAEAETGRIWQSTASSSTGPSRWQRARQAGSPSTPATCLSGTDCAVGRRAAAASAIHLAVRRPASASTASGIALATVGGSGGLSCCTASEALHLCFVIAGPPAHESLDQLPAGAVVRAYEPGRSCRPSRIRQPTSDLALLDPAAKAAVTCETCENRRRPSSVYFLLPLARRVISLSISAPPSAPRARLLCSRPLRISRARPPSC